MKKITLILFISFAFTLNAKIIEIKNIKEVINHIDQKDLIVFDLDNTLIETVQQLGSDQWFVNTIRYYENQGISKKEAFEKVYRKWLGIQYLTDVKLVEDDAEKLINKLRTQKIKILGLTVRAVEMLFATFKQLEDVNIDFSKNTIFSKELFLSDFSKVFYQKGFLFTAGHNKGMVLFSFFEKINFYPKSIVFVDDKLSHLQTVEKICKEKNIDFIGLRYSYLDDKIKNYDRTISDIQLKHFHKILSDAEAKALCN